MTAEEFLTQELKLADPDGYIQVERTEHYRELYIYNLHYAQIKAPQILYLLYKLQKTGFSLIFTSLDTFKIIAPHYKFHNGRLGKILEGGWLCQLEDRPIFCPGRVLKI